MNLWVYLLFRAKIANLNLLFRAKNNHFQLAFSCFNDMISIESGVFYVKKKNI